MFESKQLFGFLNWRKPKEYIAKGNFDMTFLILIVVLLFLGLAMLFSSSYVSAMHDSSNEVKNNPYFYLFNQGKFALIGLFLMIAVSKVRYDVFKDFAFAALAVSFILLVVVLFYYEKIPGKLEFRRWLPVPGIGTIQPSEIAKLALVMFCAWSMERRRRQIEKDWMMMIPYLAIIGAMCLLIYKENHLSGTILILCIGLVMTYLGGVKSLWFVLLIAGMVFIVWLVLENPTFTKAYVGDRITAWRDKTYEPRGARWQINQSLYAIGSGGLLGKGPGNSIQKHLFLSEAKNDFIFAVICEEFGFLGAFIVIALFSLLVWRGFVIAMKSKDRFSSLLVMGIVFQVGLQAALNIAVVTDTIPNTGIGLPFFSAGGTSLIILLVEMGMVLSVSRAAKMSKS